MYLVFEKGIPGGISTSIHRYGEANNKYMRDHDPERESSYLAYLDKNNFYGYPMYEPLPINGFEWMCEEELEKWEELCSEEGNGCTLEVDLEYPPELHNKHNDYPPHLKEYKLEK